MPLLNYTSNVDADKTAMEITRCLSSHGAQSVMTDYNSEDQTIVSISFLLAVNGKSIKFRLPCDWKPVYEILTRDKNYDRYFKEKKEKLKSDARLQAVRTAWRIVKDWVEAQMALVEAHQAKTEQVFLPYVVMKGGKTLSDQILGGELLLEGTK